MNFLKAIFTDKETADNVLYSCAAGKSIPCSEVPDPAFSQKLLGKGMAVIPSEGRIYAPCSGTVESVYKTGHAVSITSDFGASIMIHVGLHTASLPASVFEAHVAAGQHIRRGQLLITFDLAAITAAGCSVITPMVVCNSMDYAQITAVTGKTVTSDTPVMEIR